MVSCKICGGNSDLAFQANILNAHNVSYFVCSNCGFIQTEEPYWLEDAYKKSISLTDTGIIQRNLFSVKITTAFIKLFFNSKSSYVDMAGGYGLFVRMMRDKGFSFLWNDLYTENIFAQGFEFDKNQDIHTELITAFEAFEHFVNPTQELETMLEVSKNIFFSTLLTPQAIPDKNWWYYAFQTGQHISFYSKKSLLELAKKYNLQLYSNNKDFHLLTEKRLSAILVKCLFFYFKIKQYIFYRTKSFSKDSNLLINS